MYGSASHGSYKRSINTSATQANVKVGVLAEGRSEPYRNEELLDLVHGVSHPQISFRYRCCHLNEHMQFHGQVSIFGFSTLPQLLLLTSTWKAAVDTNLKTRGFWPPVVQKEPARHTPCSCLSWNLCPVLRSWHQFPPAVFLSCCPRVLTAYPQSWPEGKAESWVTDSVPGRKRRAGMAAWTSLAVKSFNEKGPWAELGQQSSASVHMTSLIVQHWLK